MDLRQLEYLIAVADAGSFTRASVALNLAQPSLSRQIGLLEAELGQRLFDRTGRGASPTEAGRLLLAHARAMHDIARRARDELRDLNASPTGRVRIGLPPRVALAMSAPLVQRFRERFPRAVVSISEGLSLHLREWLIDGRIDLALLFDPAASPQLDVRTLRREPLLLVAPADFAPLPERVTLAGLAAFPMVLPSAPNAVRQVVEAALRPRRIELQVVAEVGAVQTVLSLVAQGAGCTILPDSALASWPGGTALQRAAIGSPGIRNRLVLARPKARPETRLIRDTAALLGELDFAALAAATP